MNSPVNLQIHNFWIDGSSSRLRSPSDLFSPSDDDFLLRSTADADDDEYGDADEEGAMGTYPFGGGNGGGGGCGCGWRRRRKTLSSPLRAARWSSGEVSLGRRRGTFRRSLGLQSTHRVARPWVRLLAEQLTSNVKLHPPF